MLPTAHPGIRGVRYLENGVMFSSEDIQCFVVCIITIGFVGISYVATSLDDGLDFAPMSDIL